MARLERYIHPYWGYIILTVLIKLAGAGLELLIPYLMEIMLDEKVPAADLSGSIYSAAPCFYAPSAVLSPT